MNLIPGSSEPRIPALRADLVPWLVGLARRSEPDRIRQDVASLPAPRSRLHSPGAMRQADGVLLDAFRNHGWRARLAPFTFRDVNGYLDYGDASAFSTPTRFDLLEGANILGVKEGTRSRDAIVVISHHDTIRIRLGRTTTPLPWPYSWNWRTS